MGYHEPEEFDVCKKLLIKDDSDEERKAHKPMLNYYDELSTRGPVWHAKIGKTDLQILEEEFPNVLHTKV